MDKFNLLSKTNQKLVIITIALLLYGYLCRILNIYFFWESKSVGWTLLVITAIFLLRQRISWKKTVAGKTTSEKIGIAISVFILLMRILAFVILPRTNAYQSAIAFIKTDKTISNEVGQVKGIILLPTGGLTLRSSAQGDQGVADLVLIVKGEKKYKDYRLKVVKDFDTEWTVVKP